MQHKEIIVHLVSEITNYIMEQSPSRMVISLHNETDGLHLSVMDDIQRSDSELKKMEQDLNPKVRPELSEYYGAMAGTDAISAARLNLIGWQIKHGDVSRTTEGTKVDLWIGSDEYDSKNFSRKKKQ